MNTIPLQVADARRRRRLHSDEFKADAVAECMRPGISIAAVAMAHGVNANLLRRWVKTAEMVPGEAVTAQIPKRLAPPPAFMSVAMPPHAAATEIRIELRRGATAISVTWPSDAAADCAAWMRELLR